MSAVSALTGLRMADVWRSSKTTNFGFLLGVALCIRKIGAVSRSFDYKVIFCSTYFTQNMYFRDFVAKISESRVAYSYRTRLTAKLKT